MFMLSVYTDDNRSFSILSDACIVLHFMACYDTGHFHFKLNLSITQLEYIVDRVMVPLNRVPFPVQPHLPFWEGLDSVH